MTQYEVAQICTKGHVVNSRSTTDPDNNSNYCPTCGKTTITQCPNCRAEIKGEPIFQGPILIGSYYVAPKICDNCGAPFPWSKNYSIWIAILSIVLLAEVLYLIVAYDSLKVQIVLLLVIGAIILLSRKHVFNKFLYRVVNIIGFLGGIASILQLFGVNIK